MPPIPLQGRGIPAAERGQKRQYTIRHDPYRSPVSGQTLTAITSRHFVRSILISYKTLGHREENVPTPMTTPMEEAGSERY